jgi:hypothetical protein
MRLGCGANQEAIANVTRTRCDRQKAEQVQSRRKLLSPGSRESSERCLAKSWSSRDHDEQAAGPVSDAVGCEGGLRCQATGRAMCR